MIDTVKSRILTKYQNKFVNDHMAFKKMNRKNRNGNGSQDNRIANIARKVFDKRVEKKVWSVQLNSTTSSITGVVHSLTLGIIEGDDITNRSGTVIRLARLRMLYRGAAVTTSSSLRFILFRDMFNQGTLPSVVELLPANNLTSQYSDVREMQQNRFHIVHDHMMDVNVNGRTVVTKQFDLNIEGKVYYNGTTAVATANGRGALFLLVIGATNNSVYDVTSQVIFTDA